ncbi:hypothetical protein WJX73_003775 [Symbiochloris irregularis]|uniref:Metallo-beta-lactamase domain-containing protein n=1 Tax=Symbiochloris irregularis TaxID=706552 RepID=A0AAW1NSU3_9CHLO
MQPHRLLWSRLCALRSLQPALRGEQGQQACLHSQSGFTNCQSLWHAQRAFTGSIRLRATAERELITELLSRKRKWGTASKMIHLRAELERRGMNADGKKVVLLDKIRKADEREAAEEAAKQLQATSSPEPSTLQSPPEPPAEAPAMPAASAVESPLAETHTMSSGEADPAAAATGLAVTWLGTSSGAPTHRRTVSSICLRTPSHAFLVDCGEGTFKQLQAAAVPAQRINRIFITHLHGDHCFGLVGVLSAISAGRVESGLASQQEPLHVFGPPGLHSLIQTAFAFGPKDLAMPLVVFELAVQPSRSFPPRQVEGLSQGLKFACLGPDRTPKAQAVLKQLNAKGGDKWSSRRTDQNAMHEVPVVPGLVWTLPCPKGITVTAAQLKHRVPCWGYVFQEASSAGGAPGRKVVLLGDTCNSEAIAEVGMDADLLSHEATFSTEMYRKARVAQHSTARDAGNFARHIRARSLVLTHFSNRYSFEGSRPAGGTLLDASSGDIMQLCREASQAYGSSQNPSYLQNADRRQRRAQQFSVIGPDGQEMNEGFQRQYTPERYNGRRPSPEGFQRQHSPQQYDRRQSVDRSWSDRNTRQYDGNEHFWRWRVAKACDEVQGQWRQEDGGRKASQKQRREARVRGTVQHVGQRWAAPLSLAFCTFSR